MQGETAETPTVHNYDFEPCPECGSRSLWVKQVEDVSTTIHGEWDGDEFVTTEVNPNHQGPVKIDRLECKECGHVLIDNEYYTVTEDQIERIRDNLEAIRQKTDLEGVEDTATFTENILDEIERGDR